MTTFALVSLRGRILSLLIFGRNFLLSCLQYMPSKYERLDVTGMPDNVILIDRCFKTGLIGHDFLSIMKLIVSRHYL